MAESVTYAFQGELLLTIDSNNKIIKASEYGGKNIPEYCGIYFQGKTSDFMTLMYDNQHLVEKFKLSCTLNKRVTYIDFKDDKVLEYTTDCTVTYVNGVKHGKYVNMLVEGEYNNGVKHGTWRFYKLDNTSVMFSNMVFRNCIQECTYVNNILQGESTINSPDFSMRASGSYKNGLKCGLWTVKIEGYNYNRYISYLNGIAISMVEIKCDNTPWRENIKHDDKNYNEKSPSVNVMRMLTPKVNNSINDFVEFDTRYKIVEGHRLTDEIKI